MLWLQGFGSPNFDFGGVVVWEDDDVYLPGHVAAHAATLERHRWSKPSWIYSTYGRESIRDEPRIEAAAGRFHASIAIRTDLLEEIGGWVQTPRADFDQQLLARLTAAGGPPGDSCDAGGLTYVYRWGDTGGHHGSGLMRGPDDTTWYDRTPIESPRIGPPPDILPTLDASSWLLDAMLAQAQNDVFPRKSA
jgi:hypothetical protein